MGVLAVAVGAGVVPALDHVLGTAGTVEARRALASVRVLQRGARRTVSTRLRRAEVFQFTELA